jgi:hypothetical protein
MDDLQPARPILLDHPELPEPEQCLADGCLRDLEPLG